MAEQAQSVANAETTLKLKELEFERRATALEKVHAAKMASVLQQMSVLQNQDNVHQASEARPRDKQGAAEARQGVPHEAEEASHPGRQTQRHAKQATLRQHGDALECW